MKSCIHGNGSIIYAAGQSPVIYRIVNSEHNLRGHLVIRSSKKFYEKSVSLPPIIHKTILCKPIYKVIGGIVINSTIKQLLKNEDYKSIFECLDIKSELNTDIIEEFSIRKKNELYNINNLYEINQHIEYDTIEEKNSISQQLKLKIDSINEQIHTIKERIENYISEVCPICYDDINNPLLTECCSHIFCSNCIITSLARNSSCPLCRKTIIPTSLKNIIDKNVVVDRKKDEFKTKLDVFFEIIENNKDGKFLIINNRIDISPTNMYKECLK